MNTRMIRGNLMDLSDDAPLNDDERLFINLLADTVEKFVPQARAAQTVGDIRQLGKALEALEQDPVLGEFFQALEQQQ